MSFFSSIIDKIRGINVMNRPKRAYIFGVILSGTYSNWKHDSHPTFLCLGTYGGYVHGIQLHAIDPSYIIGVIRNFKASGTVTNPLAFFRYLKFNAPWVIKEGYRTYRYELCDFKIVNQGLTNIKNCYPPDDSRDGFLSQLQDGNYKVTPTFSMEALKNNIRNIITNTVKVWK